MKQKKIQPWKVLNSCGLNDYRIFKTRADIARSPRTGKKHEVYVVSGVSWVNVLAITPGQEIVLVQQYRHGTRTVMWEIPGGMMDRGESPGKAAARELLEETGYAGNKVRVLGNVHPNPAFQDNVCYTVLIENARRLHAPKPDGTEDISVDVVPEAEFAEMVSDGRITHSLVVVADHWRRLWRSGAIRPPML